MTKGRIAPALVTPAAGESIAKPRFRRDALPLRTSLQPRAAAAFDAYTVSNAFELGEQPLKLYPSPGGSGRNLAYMVP